MEISSPYLSLLKNRINLRNVPFSDRGSRLMVFSKQNALEVRLAERWFKRDNGLSAYRERPPLIGKWVFLDREGHELEFILDSYPHCLKFQTSEGLFILTFVDSETLMVSLPAGPCGMRFQANMDLAQPDRRGGILRMVGDIRRNIAYTTNARIHKNTIESAGVGAQQICLEMESDGSAAVLINITPRLGFNRYVQNPDCVIETAAECWHSWFDAAPPVRSEFEAQYYYAWWIMRAGLISTRYYTTREAMTPSKMHYVGVWQWDAYFHALAYRHVDSRLAQDQLRILLDHQREDGMIPDAVHDEGIVTHLNFPVDADVTKPPLIAWAACKLFEHDQDREFLEEIYEPIVRWNRWWFEKNDADENGLCDYCHPFSSGLDDSPLWDGGMPVEAPDLNSYLCLQQDSLATIARAIGMDKEAKVFELQAETIMKQMLNEMWDDEKGLFWARRNGEPITVLTPFSLFPLLTGRVPERVARRLVTHLMDPNEFWSRYPVPSVALNDPFFTPDQMWRGPTWVNVNYLLAEGLQKSGYADLAKELRSRTLALINSHDDIYEYYNPETGEAPPNAASIFGWSSAVLIDLAIQESNPR